MYQSEAGLHKEDASEEADYGEDDVEDDGSAEPDAAQESGRAGMLVKLTEDALGHIAATYER